VRPTSTTVSSSRYPIIFDIHVITQNPDPEEGSDDALWRMSFISNMLEDDRQFGGLADTSEIDEIVSDAERRRVKTRHQAEFLLRFEQYVLPR